MSELRRKPDFRPDMRPDLRRYTPARVSLETTGETQAMSEVLRFRLAHAQARDAVHTEIHWSSFAAHVREALAVETVVLKSRARDRAEYLRRPETGRALASPHDVPPVKCDLAVVVADGLSALAVERHAVPLLYGLLPLLADKGWSVGPVMLVAQGRVAIGDAIGEAMPAAISLVLIGERPGLSSADSLGAYVTWMPRRGRTDAERNCISNIRHEGLRPEAAVERLFGLLQQARAMQLTGTGLKEELRVAPEGVASMRISEG